MNNPPKMAQRKENNLASAIDLCNLLIIRITYRNVQGNKPPPIRARENVLVRGTNIKIRPT